MAVPSFVERLASAGIKLDRKPLATLQINLGKLCNQTCRHCHVDAGPSKTRENMSEATASRILALAETCKSLTTVDLTGGAPELNPNFRRLVSSFRRLGLEVIDRCNLTVLREPGQEDTAAFLAREGVHVVASLPCYSAKNVETQRGDGVFEGSIAGLRQLNQLGYGQEGSGLELDLVYNPVGASLPPPQAKLELDYKDNLRRDFGIVFNRLLTVTNMPINRFLFDLRRHGRQDAYMELLSDAFNPDAATRVMCRTLVSIGWNGTVYDCDFNQMCKMPVGGKPTTLWDIESFDVFSTGDVALANHCYACTAGAGSSCGGSLV